MITNETGTAPIVLVDGIGEFIVGSECFEVLVKERVRGAYQYIIEFNFATGSFRIEEPVRVGEPFVFTIVKITKLTREIVYDIEPYIPILSEIRQNPIKSILDMASMQIVGVKPMMPQHMIPSIVEKIFDPNIEDELLLLEIMNRFELTGHEYLVRKEISRMRSFY